MLILRELLTVLRRDTDDFEVHRVGWPCLGITALTNDAAGGAAVINEEAFSVINRASRMNIVACVFVLS